MEQDLREGVVEEQVEAEGGGWEARGLEQARVGTAFAPAVEQTSLIRQVLPVITLSVPIVAQVW